MAKRPFREVQGIAINQRAEGDYHLIVQLRAGKQTRRAPGSTRFSTLDAVRKARRDTAVLIGCREL